MLKLFIKLKKLYVKKCCDLFSFFPCTVPPPFANTVSTGVNVKKYLTPQIAFSRPSLHSP